MITFAAQKESIMKYLIALAAALIYVGGATAQNAHYGEKISAEGALSMAELQEKMKSAETKMWPVLLLFFCSGATALIYEVVWSKYLSQMFGSTIYAQTVVLAVFMGGLALGNRWFGAKADRLQRPVRAYGFVELAIGLYAFAFPKLFSVADIVFVRVGSAVLENSVALLAIKGLLSFLLLIVPTVLMGGTLPLGNVTLNWPPSTLQKITGGTGGGMNSSTR